MVSQEFVLEEHLLATAEAEDDEIIRIKRVDVHRTKLLKFAEGELEKLAAFQRYLVTTINPVTGESFIPRDEFSGMIHFSVNLAFRYMDWLVKQEAEQEAVAS